MHDTIRTDDDPILRRVCEPVTVGDPTLPDELAGMHRALARFQQEKGFGRAIAAPQVGVAKRCIALNLGATPFSVINPVITWRSDETDEVWDDCLSLPDIVVRVQRHRSISLTFDDEQGRPRVWEHLPESLAELLQHEIDHLDGILMTDRAHGTDAVRPIAEHAALVGPARQDHPLSLDDIPLATTGDSISGH